MKALVFIIMTFLLPAVNVKASAAKPASPPAASSSPAAHEHGDTAPATSHAAVDLGLPIKSAHYVHQWQEFPVFSGLELSSQEPLQIKPKLGRITILVFLASWCIPCQRQIDVLRQIETKYSDRYTDFFYIFSHDTVADAVGFSKLYKLGGNTLIATQAALQAFHQPELPSFYVADRYKWLTMRRINTQEKDLKDLDSFLALHTAM